MAQSCNSVTGGQARTTSKPEPVLLFEKQRCFLLFFLIIFSRQYRTIYPLYLFQSCLFYLQYERVEKVGVEELMETFLLMTSRQGELSSWGGGGVGGLLSVSAVIS